MRFRIISTHYTYGSIYTIRDTEKNADVRKFSNDTHLIPYELAMELCVALNKNPNHLEN
jgi:hypothetical protein